MPVLGWMEMGEQKDFPRARRKADSSRLALARQT